jgi:hypothetical protein
MRGTTLCLVALTTGFANGCAAERPSSAAGLDVIVKASPSAIAADASGARTISAATGCEAEVVRTLASGAMVVRLRPTKRAPDVQKCLVQLKALPGVQYAEPDAAMKPS